MKMVKLFFLYEKDQPLKRMIQEGIIGQYGKKYYPSDGLKLETTQISIQW